MIIWQTIVEFLVRDVAVWGDLKNPMLSCLGSIGLVKFFGWHVTPLNFDFGQASLTPSADRFLAKVMPAFAVAVCGTPRPLIAGIVIEGHTDDLGGDALNLRLSQERSLRVLIRGLEVIQASVPSAYTCFGQLTSASGRGKQDIIYDTEQRPNRELSRRVIFKILLRPGDTRA